MPIGGTLCSQCYQVGYKAWARGIPPKRPTFVNQVDDVTVPRVGASVAECQVVRPREPEMSEDQPACKKRFTQQEEVQLPCTSDEALRWRGPSYQVLKRHQPAQLFSIADEEALHEVMTPGASSSTCQHFVINQEDDDEPQMAGLPTDTDATMHTNAETLANESLSHPTRCSLEHNSDEDSPRTAYSPCAVSPNVAKYVAASAANILRDDTEIVNSPTEACEKRRRVERANDAL